MLRAPAGGSTPAIVSGALCSPACNVAARRRRRGSITRGARAEITRRSDRATPRRARDAVRASAAKAGCSSCERNGSTPISVSAPRTTDQFRFDLDDRARDRDAARCARPAGYSASSKSVGRGFDREIGEPVQTARRQRDFIGRRAIDQVDRKSERHAQGDGEHGEQRAARRMPHRPEHGRIDDAARASHDGRGCARAAGSARVSR